MIEIASIPTQLTERSQWVIWRIEQRDGKDTKVPYMAIAPTRKAAANRPETWATFDKACEAATDADGIGYMFSDDDGFVGIDIDKCVNDDGELNDVAQDIVQRLKSYTEFSPSGKGIHVIVRGTLEGLEGSRRGRVEMYESGRYFTVTGDRLPRTNSVISGEQRMLEAVHGLYVKAPEQPQKNVPPQQHTNTSHDDYGTRLDALKRSTWRSLFDGDMSRYPSKSEADSALCCKLAFYMGGDETLIDKGVRDSALYRPKWDEIHTSDGLTYGQVTIQHALAIWDGVVWSSSRKPVKVPVPYEGARGTLEPADFETEHLTELANVKRLLAHFGEGIAFTPGLGWYLYEHDTGVFVNDKGGHTVRRDAMDALQRMLRNELAEITTNSANASEDERKIYDKMRNALNKFIRKSATRTHIDAVLELLSDNCIVEADAWDSEPFVFVCANGVLDLDTGALQPFSPAHKATKRSRVSYDPVAQHEAFDALLTLLERDDRADTLQRALGSCLVGLAPNEKLFYLVGLGGTGKSTLMESVAACLGDYACNVDASLLLEQRNGNTGARPELLRLRGARLAIAGELPKHGRLDAPQVKALTGRDTITARALYSNVHVGFEPVFKLFIHSNYDVKTEWDDTGIQRRLLRIPFDAKPTQTDPQLKLTLRQDPQAQAALLRWLVAGFHKWSFDDYDLNESDVIKQAIADYHRQNNPFYLFAEDCLKFEGDGFVSSKDLWDKYKNYCEVNGEKPKHKTDLMSFIKTKGAVPHTNGRGSNKVRGYKNVSILGVFG